MHINLFNDELTAGRIFANGENSPEKKKEKKRRVKK